MNELKVIDSRAEFPSKIDASDNSPASLMIAAFNKGMDLEKLEKFMELQQRWEANEAKKAYTEAMALFKAAPPEILKDRSVSYEAAGREVRYKHASLSNVTNQINAGLGKHGLSAAWITVQNEKGITVTCTITHKMGHSESTSLSAAPDTSGSKNSIQAVGSTISYLERYTILALTGLATTDQDDDGVGAEIQHIDDKQLSTLRDNMNDIGVDETKFLQYLKVESLETLPDKKFKIAMVALDAKRKLKAKEEKAKKE